MKIWLIFIRRQGCALAEPGGSMAPNFCSWATRKSKIFHTNHMLGTLDFTGSEHWAPFNFPWSTALDVFIALYARTLCL